MDFQQAVKAYQQNPTKEVLKEVTAAITGEMSLKEKIYMLSGHPLVQMQKDMIKTGRNYNVHALPAGGCKRLGVPPVLFTDGPRGVVMGNSTCFPVSMLRASTFDTDLEYRFGKAIADEAIAQGANYFAGVCINLVRNPRWGRTQETYGEDPCLLGEFGATLTKSVQEEGMIACPKHFALNSIEDLRFYVDVKIDDKSLYEVYLPHFKKCIDAGALSIMGAYNRYEESYCCESKKLLSDILRREWGFDGFVMSDFVWGCHNTENCLRAGLDVEMMFTMQYSSGKIKKCLKKGQINEEHLDRAVNNILGVLIRQVPQIKERSMDVVGCQAHRELALEIAEKGMVLLKNDGVLPLSAEESVLVGGPYVNEANIGDWGSSRVFDKQVVTPYAALQKEFKTVVLNDGEAKTAILCVGSNRKMEGEYFANTGYGLTEKPKDGGGDRASLRLSKEEVALIKQMKEKGMKVIVAIYSGCAVIVEEWKDYADAIIMNYYSGCEGATALAKLLCGKANFSGKLPFTVAKTEEDYPEIIGIGQKPYVIDYGYYHGYTKLEKENKEAAYPFGFGLSYTTFEMNDLKVTQTEDKLTATVSVENTGKMAGAEVVQIYIGSNETVVDRPKKLLKGFKRVELAPEQKKEVSVEILKEDLRFYDDKRWGLDASYTVYAGNSVTDSETRCVSVKME